jgi:poly(beta-D-mannuronate) lyase
MEAVRTGLSYLSMSEGGTIVESNLFENCDGDPEIISVKECGGIVRNNTFVSCQGGVCLRHGNRSEVSGNFFFGNGKRGTDGIRPYGDDDRIFNNYFERLTAPALHLANGDFDYGHGELENRELLKQHFRPRNLLVAFNTIVDCDIPIQIGAGGKKEFPIDGLTMADNLIVGGAKQKVVDLVTPPLKATWLGNMVSGDANLGIELPKDQLRVVKIELSKDRSVQRPVPGSQNIDAAAGDFSQQIKIDIDGQPRSGRYDVGADEVSSAPVTNRPLTPADVGPMSPETDE